MKKVLLLVLVILLAGCTVLGNEENSHESIKSKGTIVVGTSADYPPYEFHKVIDGKDTIVGFDIQLAEKIAEDLDVELEVIDMNFDGLLPALKAGKIDFIAAGMNPTEERKESVDFTNIYYDTNQTMLVLSENKDTLTTVESFSGLKVGVQKSTLQETIFDEQFAGAEKVALSKIPNLIMELQSEKIDGIILAEVVAKQYADANPNITLNGLDLGSEGGVAIAIDKGQTELLEAMNSTIDKVIEDGTLDQYILDAMALEKEE